MHDSQDVKLAVLSPAMMCGPVDVMTTEWEWAREGGGVGLRGWGEWV